MVSDKTPKFNPNTSGAVALNSEATPNTIFLPYTLGASNNDAIVYSSGGGQVIGGLVDGQTYYFQDAGAGRFRLLTKKSDQGGVVVQLTSRPTDGWRAHSFVLSGKSPSGDASAYGPQLVTIGSAPFTGVAVTSSNSDRVAGFGIGLGFSGTAAVTVAGTVNVDNIQTSAHIGDSAVVNAGSGASASRRPATSRCGWPRRLALPPRRGRHRGRGRHRRRLHPGRRAGREHRHLRLHRLERQRDRQERRGDPGHRQGHHRLRGRRCRRRHRGCGRQRLSNRPRRAHLRLHREAVAADAYECTGNGATINAGGDVLVSAQDDTRLVLITAALAVGYVGVGVAVGVATVDKETKAYLGSNSVVDAKGHGTGIGPNTIFAGSVSDSGFGRLSDFHGLAVQSYSSENIFGLAPSVGGGFVGVAGGIGVTLLHVTTEAFIAPHANVNSDVAGANAAQSVNISAVDFFKSLTVAGGVGIGFVGVAGGVDIGVAETSVASYIASAAGTIR